MKSGINYLETSAIVSLATSFGLKATEQKGFVRIEGKDSSKRIYPAKGKKVTGRIDVSGFGDTIIEGCVAHPKPPTKKVSMLVDQSKPVAEVLATLERLFTLMGGAKAELAAAADE